MIKNSLWAEITICGFVYFIALFFLILTFLEVTNLDFLIKLKDYLLYFSVGAVAFSYILGILAHRIFIILYYYVCFIIGKTFHKQKLIEKWTNSFTFRSKIIKIYQLGTERLNRELDFQFSLLSMTWSLSIGFLLLGINLGIWLHNSIYIKYSGLFFLFFIILGLLFLIVYLRQKRLFNSLRDLSFGQIDEYKL